MATSWKRSRTTRSKRQRAAELPLALNGRLEKPGDVDFFKVSAKKGQVWEVECYARRIGSPVDPVVNIYKADKASLVGNDDARGQDSYVRWHSAGGWRLLTFASPITWGRAADLRVSRGTDARHARR